LEHFEAKDFFSLSWPVSLMLKFVFTFPSKFRGNVCTSLKDEQHSERVLWKLPQDLFIPPNLEPSDNLYPIIALLMNVPRLFLTRVFNLPLEFSKIKPGTSEIPDVTELIDAANFFLDRWCAVSTNVEEIYARVQVVNE
jgi:hypothetical protein